MEQERHDAERCEALTKLYRAGLLPRRMYLTECRRLLREQRRGAMTPDAVEPPPEPEGDAHGLSDT